MPANDSSEGVPYGREKDNAAKRESSGGGGGGGWGGAGACKGGKLSIQQKNPWIACMVFEICSGIVP